LYNTITGIVIIVNPVNSKKILLFYNTINNYLALKIRPTTSQKASSIYSINNLIKPSNIFEISFFAILYKKDLV